MHFSNVVSTNKLLRTNLCQTSSVLRTCINCIGMDSNIVTEYVVKNLHFFMCLRKGNQQLCIDIKIVFNRNLSLL